MFGPRGTGKSTWLKHYLPDAVYIDLLQPATYRDLTAAPERLSDRILAYPDSETIVIDEIQRVPELLTVIHSFIESHPRLRFIMTGSSARQLRSGGVDLLGGRAVLRTMHPFMAAELPSFSLDAALKHGMIPLVCASSAPDDVLNGYVNVYIDEEVRSEGITRNLSAFIRFMESISFSHASILNVSNVARECGVPVHVAQSYVSILYDLLLAFPVHVFRKRAKRQTVRHPKFYWFDAGVYRSLRPSGPLDRPEEIDGAGLEGLVAQHLYAWCEYSNRNAELFFWRTRGGSEADFVIYGPHDFSVLEVKNTSRVNTRDLRGIRAFRSDYPAATAIFLYRGVERLLVEDVWCVPIEEFLTKLRPNQSLDSVVPK